MYLKHSYTYTSFFFTGNFMGDIALPESTYKKPKTKEDLALQEEIEKYKQELLEGLQIEEEGLTDIVRKKTKLPPTQLTSKSYNDPYADNFNGFSTSNKNGQILKPSFTQTSLTSNSDNAGSTEKPKSKHRKRHAENKHRQRKRHRYLPVCNLVRISTN